MILLELEILNDENEWQVMSSYYFNGMQHLKVKMKQIKKMYALHNKDYRIFITLQSKLNEKRV
jgi:hypothetical protein